MKYEVFVCDLCNGETRNRHELFNEVWHEKGLSIFSLCLRKPPFAADICIKCMEEASQWFIPWIEDKLSASAALNPHTLDRLPPGLNDRRFKHSDH